MPPSEAGLMSICKALVSYLLIRTAISAPGTPPINSQPSLDLDDISQNFNLSVTNLEPVANLSGSSNGKCASSLKFPTWTAKDWNIEDCYSAVQKVYLEEVLTHPDKQFEFVARGASAIMPKLTAQRTPRKYVIREY